jgi:hypothetical protein
MKSTSDEDLAKDFELRANVAATASRRFGFRKTPDIPLGEFLEQRKKVRESFPARKAALTEYPRRLK